MEPKHNNLTQGSVFRTLLAFTGPLILAGLLQQLYYIADSVIVGNFIGEQALGAVGASAPIFNVFIYVVTGFISGYTILVSHNYGAKDYDKVSRLTNTFFLVITILAMVVAGIGYWLKEDLLLLLDTPPELLALASEYLAISFIGVPFMILYNLCSSMLRGIGDSRTPLVAIFISSIVNVVLDLVFINVFNLGVSGAAIATVIAQVFSSFYLLFYIYHKYPLFRLSFQRKALDFVLLLESLRLGLPQVIQASLGSIGTLLLQRVMNSFGVDIVTAITTAYKIDSLALLPIFNISTAISIYVGQNIGAGDLTRAHGGLKAGKQVSLSVSVVITVLIIIFGRSFMNIFGVSDYIADLGVQFFQVLALFYPLCGLQNAYLGFLQGSKDVFFTATIHVTSLALRVTLSYVLADTLGFHVIAVAEACAWVLGYILSYSRYKSIRRKKVKIGVAAIR